MYTAHVKPKPDIRNPLVPIGFTFKTYSYVYIRMWFSQINSSGPLNLDQRRVHTLRISE